MHCVELIKFDVSNTSYFLQVENVTLFFGGHGKVGEIFRKSGNPVKILCVQLGVVNAIVVV